MRRGVTCLYGIGCRHLVHAISLKRKRVSAFIIDETVIKIGNHHFWLWICIEPVNRTILGMHISNERNMFVADLISKYSKHTVYTNGGR